MSYVATGRTGTQKNLVRTAVAVLAVSVFIAILAIVVKSRDLGCEEYSATVADGATGDRDPGSALTHWLSTQDAAGSPRTGWTLSEVRDRTATAAHDRRRVTLTEVRGAWFVTSQTCS